MAVVASCSIISIILMRPNCCSKPRCVAPWCNCLHHTLSHVQKQQHMPTNILAEFLQRCCDKTHEFCPGQPGWASTKRNIHPLTPIMVINHPLSASSIYYNTWHTLGSIYGPDSLFPQSLSKFSLVYLLAWHPPLHTRYISSPNHCLLFAAHAHTIATRFAVVPRLCHLILVSLNPLRGTLSCSLTVHIHLSILISAHWSASSFSFLMVQVSLPCNTLLCTQWLYSLQHDTPLILLL